jgi:hypothetical protein
VTGKINSGGIVQVTNDGFTGFTSQLFSCPSISIVTIFPVRSGGGSTSLKLIKFPPVSHIVIRPVNRGDPVGEIVSVAVTAIVAEASNVGVSAGAVVLTAARVGAEVDVEGSMPQNKRSRSPFVAEKDGSVSKSRGPIV